MSKKFPNLLALETSSPVLSVALKKGKKKPIQRRMKGFLRHAENLLPMIDLLLKKERLRPSDIDAFLIGRGPGSFTGLRIGFATLKAFRQIQRKPCFGATSLDLIATGIPARRNTTLCVALDARKDKLFFRFYQEEKGRWIATGKAAVSDFASWADTLPSGVWIAGDALQNYGPRLKERSLRFRALAQRWWTPSALPLIEGFEKGRSVSGIPKFLEKLRPGKQEIPLYFRLSEAEERKGYAASNS